MAEPRYTQLSRPKVLNIPSGEDRKVYFTAPDVRDDPNEHGSGGYTILSSAASYTGVITVWTAISTASLEFGVLMQQEAPDGTMTTASGADLVATGNPQCLTVPVAGAHPNLRKLVAVIRNYGSETLTLDRIDGRFVSFSE